MKVSRVTRSIAAALLTVVTLTGVLSLAHADPLFDVATRTVRYDDLNLATPVGVEALYRRIQDAARDACGPSVVTGTHIVVESWKDCVNTSVRQAVLAVDRPALTTYYANRLRLPFAKNAG